MFGISYRLLNNVSVEPMDWQFNGLTLLYPFYIVER